VAGSSRQSLFQDLETQAYYNSLCPAFLTLFNVLSTKTAGNEKFVDQEGRVEIVVSDVAAPGELPDSQLATLTATTLVPSLPMKIWSRKFLIMIHFQ
jgi:hypothetical protein